jgi:hypothetical protein
VSYLTQPGRFRLGAGAYKGRPASIDAAKVKSPSASSSVNGRTTRHSWPKKVPDPVNQEVVFCAAGVLSATPFTYSLHRDDKGLVVFCFSKSEDAETFAKRFGGELFRADR